MPFIETVPEDQAARPLAELYDADRERAGYLPNYTKAFSQRPDAYRAWRQLIGAITANMDTRRYELTTVAAARRLRSSYCMLAHGKILAERFYDDATVRRLVAADGRAAELDEIDLAVVELAEKVVDDATSVTADDIERPRRLGLADAEIFDVVAAAAARCFFSKTLDALDVAPDSAYAELEPELRDALVVGPPIG